MAQASDILNINEKSPYKDITPGNQIYGGGGSCKFNTAQCQ